MVDNRFGFILHPLNGKIPILHGWQNLTESYHDISSHISNGGNVGIVCGKVSNVTVVDLDSFLFADDIFGKGVETLKSSRTEGRGHIYFKYNPNLPASKHHYLGIEIISDGGNIVLPPSVHPSGSKYVWKNPEAQIAQMSVDIESRIISLFKTETELKQHLSKCRTCTRDILKRNYEGKLLSMHGAVGREYMLAICTDLKRAGAQQEHILMFAKMIYKATFDASRTLKEWYNINELATWTCEKIREKVPEYLDIMQCQQCQTRKDLYKKKDICLSDMVANNDCYSCPYHPKNNRHKNDIQEENMFNQNNTPRPTQSLGSVQETFRYKLKNFNSGEQFTIVEEMPRSKPVRFESRKLQGKNGDFESKTYLIRIISRGIEADIEIYEKELPRLAILCPKSTENFKGSTFVFDGSNWAYMGIETQTPNKDPRQPDLSPLTPEQTKADQKDTAVNALVEKVAEYSLLGVDVSTKMILVMAEKIFPHDAVALLGYAKNKGSLSETEGNWKVN